MVVLVFSGATNDSDHIMREVRAASDAGVAIVPFRTEEVEPTPSLRYYLGGTHWLDALTEPLAVHLDRLSATVASMVGAAPRDDATPPPAGAPAAQAKWWNRVPIAAWVGAAALSAGVCVEAVASRLMAAGAVRYSGADVSLAVTVSGAC